MTEQLSFEYDVAVVAGLPQPCGLEEVPIDGVVYLNDVGDEHRNRVFGWYYGYPACCVEAFIEKRTTRSHHPVSGHLLCPACATGPMAALPPRPAERYGWIDWDEDGEPEFWPPSLRPSGDGEAA